MKLFANLYKVVVPAIVFAALFALVPAVSAGGSGYYIVRGIVRDSLTMEPLPYASVSVAGAGNASLTNTQGLFEISVADGAKSLTVSYMGYQRKAIPLKRNSFNMYAVDLVPAVTQLKEVEVNAGKYSKRNNPAVEFMRKLKEMAPLTDPLRNPYYSYGKYERVVLGLNNFRLTEQIVRDSSIPDLASHVDTSSVTGKPYLSLIVKEKRASEYFRNHPSSSIERIEGLRSDGIDYMIDAEAMRVFMEDAMREVDLYDGEINLFQKQFVSPLSPLAADFYKFYLTDTVAVRGEDCIVLSFYPHNRESLGFIGHVYVPVNDSTMSIKRVEMRMPSEANINFIDGINILQEFDKAPDGSRLKTLDRLTIELSISPGDPGLYASRETRLEGHSFAAIPDSVFTGGGSVTLSDAEKHDAGYWNDARMRETPRGEDRIDRFMGKLYKLPAIRLAAKCLPVIATSYLPTGKKSKFDIGPITSFLSYNEVEGWRLRFGGMTTANLSPHWFSRFYTAYGLRDHRWKYGFELEYAFNPKKYHSREFPVKSLRLISNYDVARPGLSYYNTRNDNIFMSLTRQYDTRALYRRFNAIELKVENRYDLAFGLQLANRRYTPSATMGIADGGGILTQYEDFPVTASLQFTPGRKFTQTRDDRYPINSDALSLGLRHTWVPKSVRGLGSAANITEMDIAKRWWLSAFGYVDSYFTAGKVWGKADYLNLFIPPANLSYTIVGRSFSLLNPMEFIISTYASLDVTYHLNGLILNRIPIVKRFKLREVVGTKMVWGKLDMDCNPTYNRDLLRFPDGSGLIQPDKDPYTEMSVGLENIFTVLRVEYVWRLNYRDTPYKTDRNGLRATLKVSF